MFNKIFVPLDGSQLAESVLPAVNFVASEFRAQVYLFHVIESRPPKKVHGQPHIANPEEGKKYLKEIAGQIEKNGIPVEFHVHQEGAEGVAESITAHVAEIGADLTIMCSHGRSGVRKLLFGSIAQQVLHATRIPLLMVPPGSGKNKVEFSCRRLQVPLDNDPAHWQGLDLLSRFAQQCDSQVFLVRVIPTLSSIPGKWRISGKLLPGTASELLNIQSEEAESQMAEKAGEFLPEKISRKIGVFRGDPAEIIPQIVREYRTDLLVLNTHGKYGLEAIWSGSFAAQICRNCSVPILFLPAE